MEVGRLKEQFLARRQRDAFRRLDMALRPGLLGGAVFIEQRTPLMDGRPGSGAVGQRLGKNDD